MNNLSIILACFKRGEFERIQSLSLSSHRRENCRKITNKVKYGISSNKRRA